MGGHVSHMGDPNFILGGQPSFMGDQFSFLEGQFLFDGSIFVLGGEGEGYLSPGRSH